MPATNTETFDQQDLVWMEEALVLANFAYSEGEVPIGAVVVWDGEVVGRGWNQNIGLSDPSAHAEIMAMRDAGQRLSNHRLIGCSLYVTLEPCPMCVGAMIHARLKRVVFGANDPKTGAAGGKFNLVDEPAHNHRLEVMGACLAEESSNLLRRFFRERR